MIKIPFSLKLHNIVVFFLNYFTSIHMILSVSSVSVVVCQSGKVRPQRGRSHSDAPLCAEVVVKLHEKKKKQTINTTCGKNSIKHHLPAPY